MKGFGPALVISCLQTWGMYVKEVGISMWKGVTVTGDPIGTVGIGRGAVFKLTKTKGEGDTLG